MHLNNFHSHFYTRQEIEDFLKVVKTERLDRFFEVLEEEIDDCCYLKEGFWEHCPDLPFSAMMMARTIEREGYFQSHRGLHSSSDIYAIYKILFYKTLILALHEQHEASIKIQAVFRGHNTRWKVPCFNWKEE